MLARTNRRAPASVSPASAKTYPPLPFGGTTTPDNYSATIAVGKAGSAGPSVSFALTAGSLPPGLSLSPPSGSGDTVA